jgi:hypothetical protein
MVLHRHGDKLYAGMERCLTQHLRSMAPEFLALSGMRFIDEIMTRWHAYHKSTQMIRDILMVRASLPCMPEERVPFQARPPQVKTRHRHYSPNLLALARTWLRHVVSHVNDLKAEQLR